MADCALQIGAESNMRHCTKVALDQKCHIRWTMIESLNPIPQRKEEKKESSSKLLLLGGTQNRTADIAVDFSLCSNAQWH